MKYSSCITNSSIISQPFEDILDTFVKSGFDAIDIPGDNLNYPIKKIKPILDTYANDLKIGELTACMNPSLDLVHPDHQIRKKAITYLKNCIEASAELGNNLTHMCFLSFPENLVEKSSQTLEKYAITAVKECCSHAEDYDVKFMIEPLFKGDVSIINRCDQAIELFSKALNVDPDVFLHDSQQFGLLQDLFHMHHEEDDMLAMIEKYNAITMHVHIADHPRGLDFNRDDSNFIQTGIKKLQELNYSHYISFETFDASWTLDRLGSALNVLKSFEK